MISLNEYIELNKLDTKIKYIESWEGDIIPNTKAILYETPTKNEIKKTFAFISYPSSPTPKNGYPAVILIHGGGGTAFFEMSSFWAQKGFVTIAPDFNGKYAKSIYERMLDNPTNVPKGYGSSIDLHSENPWAYFGVLQLKYTIDLLTQLDNIDTNNIFSCGLSWGGFLNLLFISQEKRIKASSVIYSSAFIFDSEWAQKDGLSKLKKEDIKDYNDYIDPKAYLKQISCPVLFTAGADDPAFKMENRRKTAENISSKTFFALRQNFEHGNFVGFTQPESPFFFDCFVKNKKFPEPLLINLNNSKFYVKSYFKCSNLFLYATKDDVAATEIQSWKKITVKNKQKINLEAYSAIFLTEEKNNLIFSTNLILNQ